MIQNGGIIMGSKKSGILEKIKEGDQIGRKAIEVGEKLEGDGREIKSLLNGIDTSMDEDDASAVKAADHKYDTSTKAAFKEDVETKESEMEGIENEASDSANEELEKVNDAEDKFKEMTRITDVGRSNAEGAADKMRSSAAEYEKNISDAISIVKDTKSDVASLKNSIESIFG